MTHDDLRRLDAAYVLGALDPQERLRFEEHVRGCPTCARSVEEVRALPRLLAQVEEPAFLLGEEVPPVAPVPDTLLPGLLRQVTTQRRRRRGLALAGSAAAVLLAVGGAIAWTDSASDPAPDVAAGPSLSPAAPAPVPMVQVGQDTVSAALAMEDVPWGTRLELTCTYRTQGGSYGIDGAPSYTLAVQTRDGAWQQVATWRAVPGRTITVDAATAAQSDEIVQVEIRTTSGRPLLELGS